MLDELKNRRIGLVLQYDGSPFCGWQRQQTCLTVQGLLEEAIYSLDSSMPPKAIAAGRTDAGVHAAGQIVHFDCGGPIPASSWAGALNGRLPASIRVRESVECPERWHACHSALFRRYRYTIYNGRKPNLFINNWTWHKYNFLLDQNLMKKGLEALLGSHDFSAFEKTGSNRKNSITTVQFVDIKRQGDLLYIEIQATGFLYGMVRLLVGQLVALGEHRLTFQAFKNRLEEGKRYEVKESAPAKGLCFLRAGYKENLFSKSAFFDSQPKFQLDIDDSPSKPEGY